MQDKKGNKIQIGDRVKVLWASDIYPWLVVILRESRMIKIKEQHPFNLDECKEVGKLEMSTKVVLTLSDLEEVK